MSGEAIGWAFRKVQMDDPTTKLVLVALCNYANQDDEAWPANAALMRVTGLSLRAVQQSIKRLTEWGLISRARRSRDNGSERTAMVSIDLNSEWIITRGDARRAPYPASNASPGVQEVPEGGAPDAPLETTLNQQEEPTIAELPLDAPKVKKVKTRIPDNFPMTERHIKFAADRGFPEDRARAMFEKFKLHHGAKGSLFLKWDLVWNTWVLNQIEFGKKEPAPRYEGEGIHRGL